MLDRKSVSITYLGNDIKYGNDYFYEDVVNSKGYDLLFKIKKIEDNPISIKRYSCYYFMKKINELNGIIEGIVCDSVINDDEVDSIIFAKGQIDDIGEATEDDYYLVPLK